MLVHARESGTTLSPVSDSAQGPGWWIATDGRWYPPEQHADAGYRATWTASLFESSVSPEPGPLSDQFPEAAAPISSLPAPTAPSPSVELSVGYPDRPPVLPSGVAPPAPAPSIVEGDGPVAPPVEWPVYQHPIVADPPPEVDPHDRLIGVLMVIAGLVLIAASFLPWVAFDGGAVTGDLSGWHRGEGVVTVLAGFLLAGVGGAIAAGARSKWLRLAAMGASIGALMVFAIDLIDITLEADDLVREGVAVDLDQAYGLWLIAVAGCVGLVLSIVARSSWGSVDA